MLISNIDQFCFRTDKNYYLQVFLEECKYVVKEKKFLSILMTNSDEKILIKKILIKKIIMKKIKKNTNITRILKIFFKAYNKNIL